MKILVGSRALEVYGLNRNPPKDWDYWVDQYSLYSVSGLVGDVHELPHQLLKMLPSERNKQHKCYVPSPDAIYTIKCSHLAWDIKWLKTKRDILWLKKRGCKLIPELYGALKKHWEEVHGDKSFLSLKQDKEDFFTDNVTYKYDHDYLHELVAYPHKPMYKYCLKDGEDVLIDEDKFNNMCEENKVRMFREEITVIAIERWMVNNKCNYLQAYEYSLKKTITNLTKNWANNYIIQNLNQFIKPDYSLFKHCLKTLNLEENNMGGKFAELAEKSLFKPAQPAERILLKSLCEQDFSQFVELPFDPDTDYELHEVIPQCYGDNIEYIFTLLGKTYKVFAFFDSYESTIDWDNVCIREVTKQIRTITEYV